MLSTKAKSSCCRNTTLDIKGSKVPRKILKNLKTNIKNAESLSRKNREFLDLIFEYGFVSVINKPIRVTKTTPTVIDYIITNSLLHGSIDTTVFKLDISNHFAIF